MSSADEWPTPPTPSTDFVDFVSNNYSVLNNMVSQSSCIENEMINFHFSKASLDYLIIKKCESDESCLMFCEKHSSPMT